MSPTTNNYPLSVIHTAVNIPTSAQIGPFTTIEADVEIGEGTVIGSNVTIRSGVKIGKNCRIEPGAYLSSDTQQLEFWKDATQPQVSTSQLVIGDHVHIEPSATLHGGIVIGDHCWIGSGATIHDGARIGKHCKIFPGAVVSAIPQDLKFHGEKTTLEIGDHTVVRECATLNRGTEAYGKTRIGSHVLIMAYVHIAHDCIIGDHVTIANATNIAGHVEIGDYVTIGGVSAFHQFVKVGKHAFVAGGSLVRKDVPPFVKAGREPLRYDGVNSIGLRRRGFSNEMIANIQDIYRHVFLSGRNTAKALDYIETHLPATEERDETILFIRNATRGIIKGYNAVSSTGESSQYSLSNPNNGNGNGSSGH